MVRGSILAGLSLAAAIVIPQTASAQTREIENPPEVVVQKQTGVRFERQVAGFVRSHVTEYAPDGSDMSVGYQLGRDHTKFAEVTVYVYPSYSAERYAHLPAAARCEMDFESIDKDIGNSYQDAKKIADHPAAPPVAGWAGTGRIARYTLSMNFAGTTQPLLSDSYLYCVPGSTWLIAVRASWPKDEEHAEDVKRLIAAIDWPAAFAQARSKPMPKKGY